MRSERKQGSFPRKGEVFAYVGSIQNLKDLTGCQKRFWPHPYRFQDSSTQLLIVPCTPLTGAAVLCHCSNPLGLCSRKGLRLNLPRGHSNVEKAHLAMRISTLCPRSPTAYRRQYRRPNYPVRSANPKFSPRDENLHDGCLADKL